MKRFKAMLNYAFIIGLFNIIYLSLNAADLVNYDIYNAVGISIGLIFVFLIKGTSNKD